MRVAVDIDGTIDAAPRQLQSIMSALRACGHTIIVVTGSQQAPVTETDWSQKANYLNQLGCGACWDELVVLANPSGADLPDMKSQWLADNQVDVFIDNNVANCKAATAAGIPLVLCPWASKEK